jgi:hypothetical protein
MTKNKFFLALCILIFTQSANAFDNNRKGFLLGLGVGNNYTFIEDERGVNADDLSGFTASFKIGGGINNHFSMYLTRNVSVFNNANNSYQIALNGLGLSYFLSPSASSGYFMGAIGNAQRQSFDDTFSDYSGSGFMIGGGYEFIKHLQLEGAILSTDLKHDNFNSFILKTTTYQLTINYVWY